MSAEKYQLGLFNYRCWLLFFLFHPWIILGRCRFGNVRSESSGHASFWDLDLSSFPGRRRLAFFSINIGESCFLPRWANVFVADEMRACQCRPKHNLARKTLADLHCKFCSQYRTTKKYYRPVFVKKKGDCDMVMVMWGNDEGDSTWELEDRMRELYPSLFIE